MPAARASEELIRRLATEREESVERRMREMGRRLLAYIEH
jgi:hypothetical protein